MNTFKESTSPNSVSVKANTTNPKVKGTEKQQTRAMKRRETKKVISRNSQQASELESSPDENDWIVVTRRRSQHESLFPRQSYYGDDWLLSSELNTDISLDGKCSSWSSDGGKRHNHKEKKKRRRKRAFRGIEPHAEEEEYEPVPELAPGIGDSDDEDSDDEYDSDDESVDEPPQRKPDPLEAERHELRALAEETDPIDKSMNKSQDLLDALASIKDVVITDADSDEINSWISHLENIVIMAYQINQAKSFADVFVAVIAYIKMNSKGSVLKQILELIDEVTAQCPRAKVETQAWEGRTLLQNWDLFKTNTVFTKISYLLSAAMSLSVCAIKEIEWSPFGLQLVAIQAAEKQLNAVDVVDAVLETFCWFAETGYKVIEQKSLAPILYADQAMRDYNDECDFILANADAIIAGNVEEINDFDKRVDDVLRATCERKQVKCDGPTSLWLQKRYSELVAIKHRIIAKHRNTAIRFAPFGVGIAGPSGVGKSTLSKLVMKVALHAMGFDTDPRRIITKDMFDAYDSIYTSDILGMFMDDVGNGKAEHAKVSPTDIIIKFFNNMAAQAVKAELNAKGVVFIAFKVGVITSNFYDYGVRSYTNKPEAVLRRFVHTHVAIKPKYRKEGGVSLDPYHPDLEKSDLTQDVWELDLLETHITPGDKKGKENWENKIMTVELEDGRKIKCQNLDLPTYLECIIALARRHKRSQTSVIARSNEFDNMQMCSECAMPKPMCKCIKPHGLEAIGDVFVEAAKKAVSSYIQKYCSPVHLINSVLGYKPVKKMATKQLADEMQHVINETATPLLIAATPDWLFRTSVFKRSVAMWQKSAAVYDLRRQLRFGLTIALGMVGLSAIRRDKKLAMKTIAGSWCGCMLYWSQYRARVQHYEEEYLRRRDALPDYVKNARDSHVVKGAFAVTTLIVGVKLFRLWNKARLAKKFNPDGALDKMDESPSWFGHMMKKMGLTVETSPDMRRVTTPQMESAFKRNNLFWAVFKRGDGTLIRCNIFFPRKSVAWFPRHAFFPGSDMTVEPSSLLEATVYRDDKPGGRFTFKCEYSACVHSDEHDLVCAYVPNCPDLKTRIKFLPLTQPKGMGTCQMLVRREAEHKQERVTVQYGMVGHKYAEFYGGSYHTSLAQNGACMGMLLSEAKTPFIAGFHIGGKADENYGCMQTVTQQQALDLISQLSEKPGVLLSAETGTLPATQFGRPLIHSTDVHPQSVFAQLDSSAYIEILGSTKLRTQQKSRVEKSVISDAVEEATGVSNKWGPPELRPNWKAYNATLEHIVNPADMFAPSALERARQDWLRPLLVLMREHSKKEDFRPLDEKEMVCGIDGKRFIDAIDMSTSMGFPIFQKKDKYFTRVHDDNGNLVNYELAPEVTEEMERLFGCWQRGERGYPVTSATLKDEPTPLNTSKVRVFQAGAVAFGLYIRKYFLPIARFLSLNALTSESAVGVNAFSNQWEELMDHANKFASDDKVIAWDYSKYDVRMNSQVTRAVFLSFIDLAREGGYDSESLRIMENMVTDIVHPVIDYNGTLIMSYNMNTSGNNVTVNVNSTAGSFYVRLGFFDAYPDASNFRDHVTAMTYGDDFKGSVHPDFRNFNFVTYKAFLARHGMKLTLPNKSDDVVEFMDEKDADFLKRHSQFIPEINTKIGKLGEDSIFKSLHANVRSKTVTPLDVSISCIETAMHEWFAHGREVYESRQKQMEQVCKRMSIVVPAVKTTFDERVEHWLSKYSA